MSFTLLTFGTLGVHDGLEVQGVLAEFSPVWQVPVRALMLMGGTSMTLFWFIFPSGGFVPRWLRWPVAAWAASEIYVIFFPGSPLDPAVWPAVPFLLYWILILAAILYAQIYRYRFVSSYRQRQQTKWVVYGMGLALNGALAAALLTQLGPLLGPAWAPLALAQDTSYYPFLLFIPLSIGIAILRSRLYDIDIIIRRTLIYGVLTGMLALTYLGSVVVLQRAVASRTGEAAQWVVVVSTLLIAALFRPLHAAIQQWIDRRFYRRRYDGQATLAAFSARLREPDNVGLENVTEQLLGVIQETMQPAHISVWLQTSAQSKPGSEGERRAQ
jgi:hypothetical protein